MGATSTFSKGDRIDRFEIRELIGEGGMGAIYRAVDTRLGRAVALKVVRPDRIGSSAGEQARQRFLREALAISKVDHRNVVRVLDFGFSGDTPYLAMEYLRGRDLGKVVKASAGPLPIAEVADVALGVCAAIRACHDADIIHRDLKPSNIFLCESDGERLVKILDFGVSKPPIASDLTREGQIIGTPQYLAPEQVDGKAVPQTDQYAIGVVLYACLTKTLPYQDYAGLGLLRAIMLGKFPPPRALRAELPEKLEEIILRAMRARPEERFESVHVLGRELWPFGSPDARAQWRAYYLDERLKAPAKASTHAMPLIEAMARGLAVEGPVRDAMALASTAAAEPPAEKLTPVATETAAGPVVEKSTPLVAAHAPAAVADKSTPLVATRATALDLSQAAAAPERLAIAAGATRRLPLAWIALGTIALAGAGWLALGRRSGGEPPKMAAPAPVAPIPAPPRAEEPAHFAPPPPREAAAAPAPPGPPARAIVSAPPPARTEKHHRRNAGRSAAEQTADAGQHKADGVPIMP